MRKTPLKHGDTVAARTRSEPLRLLSPFNDKSPKGEAHGFLTAMLYLAPAQVAGGKTVCPHSTEACRAGCLFTAGRGKTPRVESARIRRTRWYHDDREGFMRALDGDLELLQTIADHAGLRLAIRLNGTSDVLWERETVGGRSLFDIHSRARFYDYTNTPPEHRKVPSNWHLTHSLADHPLARAVEHLRAGRNVAAVVPETEKAGAPDWFTVGDTEVRVVDGEAHDLRFLDPSPALVLLKPKGRLTRGGPMVRHNLIRELFHAGRPPA